MTQLPTPTCVCVQERVRELPPGALPEALHPSQYMEILHAKASPNIKTLLDFGPYWERGEPAASDEFFFLCFSVYQWEICSDGLRPLSKPVGFGFLKKILSRRSGIKCFWIQFKRCPNQNSEKVVVIGHISSQRESQVLKVKFICSLLRIVRGVHSEILPTKILLLLLRRAHIGLILGVILHFSPWEKGYRQPCLCQALLWE